MRTTVAVVLCLACFVASGDRDPRDTIREARAIEEAADTLFDRLGLTAHIENNPTLAPHALPLLEDAVARCTAAKETVQTDIRNVPVGGVSGYTRDEYMTVLYLRFVSDCIGSLATLVKETNAVVPFPPEKTADYLGVVQMELEILNLHIEFLRPIAGRESRPIAIDRTDRRPITIPTIPYKDTTPR